MDFNGRWASGANRIAFVHDKYRILKITPYSKFGLDLLLEQKRRMAEGVGFEPTGPGGPPVFKTGAIDHSATPP